MGKLKPVLNHLFVWGTSIIAATLIVTFSDSNYIISSDFTLTFLGLALGVSLTIITFVHTLVDKMNSTLSNLAMKNSSLAKKSKLLKENIRVYFKELEQNALYIFGAFVFNIFLIVAAGITGKNTAVIERFYGIKVVSFLFIGEVLRIVTFVSALFAVYDTIKSLSKILDCSWSSLFTSYKDQK